MISDPGMLTATRPHPLLARLFIVSPKGVAWRSPGLETMSIRTRQEWDALIKEINERCPPQDSIPQSPT